MDELHLSLIEAEAQIQKDAFCSSDWSIFSCSMIWHKIKRNLNRTERAYFQKSWEEATC